MVLELCHEWTRFFVFECRRTRRIVERFSFFFQERQNSLMVRQKFAKLWIAVQLCFLPSLIFLPQAASFFHTHMRIWRNWQTRKLLKLFFPKRWRVQISLCVHLCKKGVPFFQRKFLFFKENSFFSKKIPFFQRKFLVFSWKTKFSKRNSFVFNSFTYTCFQKRISMFFSWKTNVSFLFKKTKRLPFFKRVSFFQHRFFFNSFPYSCFQKRIFSVEFSTTFVLFICSNMRTKKSSLKKEFPWFSFLCSLFFTNSHTKEEFPLFSI